MFTGDLTSEQGKQDYENYIMNNVRNEINSYTKQSQINNASSSVSGASGSLTGSVVLPSGVIVPFAGGPGVTPNPGTRQDLPDGWLLCNGATISRTAYSALFTVVGTTYGAGDGSTTFHVPDLRGRIIVGSGTGAQQGVAGSGVITGGAALAVRSVGQFFGDERTELHNHLQNSHNHTQNSHNHTQDAHSHYTFDRNTVFSGIAGGSSAPGLIEAGSRMTVIANTATNQAQTATNIAETAINQSQFLGTGANTQPSIVTNYIIKT
jgi:microcystin-dependent protein